MLYHTKANRAKVKAIYITSQPGISCFKAGVDCILQVMSIVMEGFLLKGISDSLQWDFRHIQLEVKQDCDSVELVPSSNNRILTGYMGATVLCQANNTDTSVGYTIARVSYTICYTEYGALFLTDS